MTDVTPTPSPTVALPNFADAIIRAIAQKGLTAMATALTGAGFLPKDLQSQFIVWGIAAVLWLASFSWTYLHEKAEVLAKKEALNADPPVPPVPLVK